MERLVGRRYKTLEELKNDIEKVTNRKINAILESESERFEELDYMIDYEFIEQEDVYTLYYLKDNAGNYYLDSVSVK